jgi:hypothetical protein
MKYPIDDYQPDLIYEDGGLNQKEISFAALAPQRGLFQCKVRNVELAGDRGKLKWTHDDHGVVFKVS